MLLHSISPLKDSWVTSAVPINVPKYASYQESASMNHVTLDLPEVDHKTFVKYEEGDGYLPLRVTFATDHLLKSVKRQRSEPITSATIQKIDTLTGDILPAVSEIWAGALSVFPSADSIFPVSLSGLRQEMCGEAKIPPQHMTHGVPNTDTLICNLRRTSMLQR